MIRIGCEYHSIETWLKDYKKVGAKNSYTELEIKLYGNFIKNCAKLEKYRK